MEKLILKDIDKDINRTHRLMDYPDVVFENMFDCFTQEEQNQIQKVLDKCFPINDDDWTKEI